MHRHSLLRLAALLPLLLLSFSVDAVVAKPGLVSIKQPDGSVKQVYLHGDEFFHYMTDATGNVVQRDASGYLKQATINASNLQEARQLREKAFADMKPLLSNKMERMPITKSSEVQSHKGLVILVNFKDNSFTIENPKDAFGRMLNEAGYSDRGGTGSVRDYYMDNSNGQFEPSFDVYGPYTLPNNMEYYGGNEDGGDKNPWQMAIDAVDAAYADSVVLSDYDNDKDGILDYVFIYYAGYGEAQGGENNTIWPHASTMYYRNIVKGGVRYGTYACSCELCGSYGAEMDNIGTFCHEFGHVLGLVDLYDTDYEESGGQSTALGKLSLMSSGSYNNDSRTPPCLIAEERATIGWMEPKTLTAGSLSLPPIAKNEAYRLDTENNGEYFLFETRKREGWDKYIYGDGLLIYHVDKSANVVYDGQTAAALWSSNAPNVYPGHECMKVVLANNRSLSGAFYPGSSNNYTSFTAYTKPAARAWSMLPLSLQLTDIKLETDGSVSFTSSEAKVSNELMGKVTDFYNNPISGATLTLTPSEGGNSLNAVSDGDGSYLFTDEIVSGEYVLRCEASEYISAERQVTMADEPQSINFCLIKEGETDWNLSWSSGSLAHAVGCEGAFSVAAFWEPGDVAIEKKLMVKSAKLYIYDGKPTSVTARVYVDGKLAGEKKLSSSDIKLKSYNEVDFSDLKIRYFNTQSLEVVFVLSGHTEVCYVGMDDGPANAGKGDLIGDEKGEGMVSVYESDEFDYNWLLSASIGTIAIQSLGDGLVCMSGQRSMYLEWEEIGETWSCTLTGNGKTVAIDTLTSPHVYFDNLVPGEEYEIHLEGYTAEDGLVAQHTFTHTMSLTQSRPMYISYSASEFKSDGRMLLEVFNLKDGAKVTWMVDGKEYKEPLLTLKSASQTVEAHVYVSATEGTEMIRRKVCGKAESKSSLNGSPSTVSLPKLVIKNL